MDARARCLVFLLALWPALGASYRTQNFIVTAPTPQLAAEIAQAAESFRRDLALEWLRHELPNWSAPCPIVARVDPSLGAGGRTSFIFYDRQPSGWDMEIQGSRQRILDSVLPHEVTHTIFATHFGCPLPRWADEGACTTVEHEEERNKQEQWLIRFLKTERGIPFNRMFEMTEYPGDILPLYSQGYSLARFLIAQGGRPRFIDFVGQGLETRDWSAAVRQSYGYESLGKLQLTWVEWVKQGSPADIQLASAASDPFASAAPPTPKAVATAPPEPRIGPASRGTRPLIDNSVALVSSSPQPVERPDGSAVVAANPAGRSWYARRQVDRFVKKNSVR
jgi:hypothetical protein